MATPLRIRQAIDCVHSVVCTVSSSRRPSARLRRRWSSKRRCSGMGIIDAHARRFAPVWTHVGVLHLARVRFRSSLVLLQLLSLCPCAAVGAYVCLCGYFSPAGLSLCWALTLAYLAWTRFFISSFCRGCVSGLLCVCGLTCAGVSAFVCQRCYLCVRVCQHQSVCACACLPFLASCVRKRACGCECARIRVRVLVSVCVSVCMFAFV